MADSFAVDTLADWPKAWQWLAPKLNNRKVIALQGDLGAGKTSFVKAIVECLGITDEVTSPTFSLVQEYPGEQGVVFHFDLYRLQDLSEVIELDFESYLTTGMLSLVEWPEIAKPFLSDEDALWVNLEVSQSGGRTLQLIE